ncbi:hypothetical protein BJV78DRAFT_1156999 [Lactifluus subvellereus]|nr:hypothetical protein BJV78DRAFT_1156999 [Lactifluus subvellereus]
MDLNPTPEANTERGLRAVGPAVADYWELVEGEMREEVLDSSSLALADDMDMDFLASGRGRQNGAEEDDDRKQCRGETRWSGYRYFPLIICQLLVQSMKKLVKHNKWCGKNRWK